MKTERIKINWKQLDTGEEKEVYSFDLTLAELYHYNRFLSEFSKDITLIDPRDRQGTLSVNLTKHINLLNQITLFKKRTVIAALVLCDWNQTEAAKKLGIKRNTLCTWMKELQLDGKTCEHLSLPFVSVMLDRTERALIEAEKGMQTQENIRRSIEYTERLLDKLKGKQGAEIKRVSNG